MKAEELKLLLNAPNAIIAQGRFLIADYTRSSDEAKKKGLYKIALHGTIAAESTIKELSGEFEMLECDIIIVPRKLHSQHVSKYMKGAKYSAYLNGESGNFADSKTWKKHTKL